MKTSFTATGTNWNIETMDQILEPEWQRIVTLARDRIEIFEQTYSRFRDNSTVGLMAKSAGRFVFPEDAELLFRCYEEMYEVSGGLVTPLVGQVLNDVGYDAKYSLVPKQHIHRAQKMSDVLQIEYPKIGGDGKTIVTTREPVMMDFGGLGKGYIVDIVSDLLKKNGIRKFIVDAGGDIAHFDADNIARANVGLENPNNVGQVIGVSILGNQSICGSSGNRRRWDKYHHVINPETTESPVHIKAVWAVATNTVLADALTTAMFFVDVDKLRAKYKFEYVIIYADNSFRKSNGFVGRLF
jgi:thiamine biosynthesis lipoprotein